MSTPEIMLDEKSNILGPFLCRPSATSMSFWMCTPVNSKKPVIEVNGKSVKVEAVVSSLENLPMKIWIGIAEGLVPDTLYRYQTSIDGSILSFPGGNPEDFSFVTLKTGEAVADDKFIVMSCHGVDEYNKKNKKGELEHATFNMWTRLLETVCAESNIKFGFLAGDQVYMDETFNLYLIRPKEKLADQEVVHKSLETYHRFWSDLSYRKVHAKIPFFLTWDDHDLIDGWGSRDEQGQKDLKDKWNSYYKVQSEIARLMQFCRNPISEHSGVNNFYFSFEHGQSLFSVLDLRSERRRESQMMLSDAQKEIFVGDLEKSNAKDHFIVSSVTMARMNGAIEKGIGKGANLIWQLSSSWGYEPNMGKVFAWMVIIVWALLPRTFPIVGDFELPPVVAFLIPSYFTVRYFKKFRAVLGRKGTLALWVFSGVGSLVAVLDLIFSKLSKSEYSQSFVEYQIYCLASVVAGTYLLSAVVLKSKIKWLQYLSIGVIAFGWLVYFLFTPNPTYAPTDLFLSIIAIVAVIFTVLEAYGTVDLIAGLDDDTEDSWSSATNQKSLHWLLGILKGSSKRTSILSGDIHTSGISVLEVNDSKFAKKIPQIVASPITYPVMDHFVEKLTSSPGSQREPVGNFNLVTYNIFYRSKRNFCVIEPNAKGVNAEFHFEDLNKPMKFFNVHEM